jgi:hypothetical protein
MAAVNVDADVLLCAGAPQFMEHSVPAFQRLFV